MHSYCKFAQMLIQAKKSTRKKNCRTMVLSLWMLLGNNNGSFKTPLNQRNRHVTQTDFQGVRVLFYTHHSVGHQV